VIKIIQQSDSEYKTSHMDSADMKAIMGAQSEKSKGQMGVITNLKDLDDEKHKSSFGSESSLSQDDDDSKGSDSIPKSKLSKLDSEIDGAQRNMIRNQILSREMGNLSPLPNMNKKSIDFGNSPNLLVVNKANPFLKGKRHSVRISTNSELMENIVKQDPLVSKLISNFGSKRSIDHNSSKKDGTQSVHSRKSRTVDEIFEDANE
jgi:hypothetical protein